MLADLSPDQARDDTEFLARLSQFASTGPLPAGELNDASTLFNVVDEITGSFGVEGARVALRFAGGLTRAGLRAARDRRRDRERGCPAVRNIAVTGN
ncbi:MAG TPA: hypothetical protein VF482_12030 [Trebonia sp.]